MALDDLHIARQAVLDASRKLVAYRLTGNKSDDGEQDPTPLLANACLELGMPRLSSGKRVLFPVSSAFLSSGASLPLDPGATTLELLPSPPYQQLLTSQLIALAGQGFSLAIDEHVWHTHQEALAPLHPLLIVDARDLGEPDPKVEESLVKDGLADVLARHVDDKAGFEKCLAWGCTLFQGEYFTKPDVVKGREMPANKLALMHLVAKLQGPDCELRELQEIISQDPAISLKLMKIINSSFYGFSAKVQSIQHALILLGLQTMKNWITVISMSMSNDKHPELITQCLVRAQMARLMAREFACKEDAAFTVGLFSLLDALMDQPLAAILDKVPVGEEVSDALIIKEGPLGRLLKTIIIYEQGAKLDQGELSGKNALLRQAYLDALEWAEETTRQLQTG